MSSEGDGANRRIDQRIDLQLPVRVQGYDADGTRWVIDWQTSRHEGGDREAFLDRELERYRAQLGRYADAMRSVEPGRPLRVGLYFPLLDAWREV